jgi:hypothetical protein
MPVDLETRVRKLETYTLERFHMLIDRLAERGTLSTEDRDEFAVLSELYGTLPNEDDGPDLRVVT